MRQRVYVLIALAAALICPAAFAAVPVDINSGDPAFPFPQFLPYRHTNGDALQNLGTRNPVGVVHAEMEKTIRDAYQIMMNRANYYESYALGETKYIKFRSNPDGSEGTGYAMLAAAMMADKTTFDGLWLFTHDFAMNKVVRYIDGSNPPAYNFSTLPGWTNKAGDNSAADGDFDIAMALLIAHKQWGDLMGINDSRGNPISYKNDVIKVLKGLSDTLTLAATGKLLSGDIGLDGYFKSGDSWGELTKWAESSQNLASIGIAGKSVEMPSGGKQYVNYAAPAYFRQFADFLRREDSKLYAWNIFQFERAEASSDWLMGKHHRQNSKNIPVAGSVEIKDDTSVTFTTSSDGEDFRAPWRTILSYVWHGNPGYTWDPVTHTVTGGKPNTFLKDAGERFSDFLWDRRQAPWNRDCETITGEGTWWGPSMLKSHYTPRGETESSSSLFITNWMHGTGSPAAVTSRDFDLMAEMYRQAELEWDVQTKGDGYLTSVPQYFHGFFRLLGMMTLTGNHHAPSNMERQANMKVYLDVDKTYAFENDTVTYTVDYRNYGARDAQNVVITSRLRGDINVVSAAGGGTYDSCTNSVRWDIGTVPGFKTAAGVNPTKGTVSFKAVVSSASIKRCDNSVEITCSNGSGWVSNEYPNKISSIMKRNGVDIVRRGLWISQSVSKNAVNPGMTATYTIDFENSTGAGQLSGGRPGVNFSYAHTGTSENAGSHTFMIRAFHDAHEAYIDYGNYRISYFAFDDNYKSAGSGGWQVPVDVIYPSAAGSKVTLRHEMITLGEDASGKWNQRLIMQLADVESSTRTDTNWATMAAPTPFLINYYGLGNERVHRGATEPLKVTFRMHANYSTRSWGGDWSFNPQAAGKIDDDRMANWGYPVSPDFTESYDPDYQGKPVTSLHRKLCASPPSTVIDNVLIEEWDGYTWRRVFGSVPQTGREVSNVVIIDTLPQGVTFENFIEPFPLGIAPEYNAATRVISWKADKMPVGKGGKIRYNIKAGGTPTDPDLRVTSHAWMSADDEQTTGSSANLVVTNNVVSVLETERTIPQNRIEEPVVNPPEAFLAEQFTAGPNPVSKSNGAIKFFRSGKKVKSSTLRVYDASGNVVSKLKINDKTQSGSGPNRTIGSWDLKDMKKRPVPEGTYLVKGVLTAADGSKEKISMILGVVK